MNLLAIEGGGPVIPTILMLEIERRTGKRTSDLFQLIVGVSSGGAVAICFTAPGFEEGRAKAVCKTIKLLFSSESQFEMVTSNYFRGLKLSQLQTDVVLICYDAIKRERYSLKSRKAREASYYDLSLETALQGVCGGSYIRKSVVIERSGKRLRNLQDGSVLGNDPVGYAQTEFRRKYEEQVAQKPVLLSIGTGITQASSAQHLELSPQSLLLFTQAASGVVFDQPSSEFFLSSVASSRPERSYRLDVELPYETKSLWISDDGFSRDEEAAKSAIVEKAAYLDELCEALLSNLG